MPALPADPTICFAHAAYRLKARFDAARPGGRSFEVTSREALRERAAEADVIVASGLWDDAILARAPGLVLVQSISAGVERFDREAFARAGVRLASASGVNARAVAHHALALVLALARRLPEARDDQARAHWRPMQGDPALREDELTDKTMLIVGLGAIGARIAALAKAFEMRVVGVRRDPAAGAAGADAVHGLADLPALLPEADFVVLACPLTPETTGLLDARGLASMRPGAGLINVARGACVVEADLVAALASGRIRAGIDVAAHEPLPADSPLWRLPNALVTPHTAGETHRYEASVVDILIDNLDRLARGETALRNAVV